MIETEGLCYRVYEILIEGVFDDDSLFEFQLVKREKGVTRLILRHSATNTPAFRTQLNECLKDRVIDTLRKDKLVVRSMRKEGDDQKFKFVWKYDFTL